VTIDLLSERIPYTILVFPSNHDCFSLNILFNDAYRSSASVAASTQLLAYVLSVLSATIVALKTYLATVLKVLLAAIAASSPLLAMLLSVQLAAAVALEKIHAHLLPALLATVAALMAVLVTLLSVASVPKAVWGISRVKFRQEIVLGREAARALALATIAWGRLEMEVVMVS